MRKREGLSVNDAIEIKNYTTEATVPADSSAVDKTVSALQKIADGRAMITSIVSSRGSPGMGAGPERRAGFPAPLAPGTRMG